MTVLKAHFDGKVLVPDEPVDLPVNCALEVHVKALALPENNAESTGVGSSAEKPLLKLLEVARQFSAGSSAPADLAAQHDHYLYGLPKRP